MTGCIFQSSDRRDKGKGASRFRACSIDLGRCMSLWFYCRLSMMTMAVWSSCGRACSQESVLYFTSVGRKRLADGSKCGSHCSVEL